MAQGGKPFKVDTEPSKEVVVDGLTRDASIEACIFDLIDNSIDAARETIFKKLKPDDRQSLPDNFTAFKIELSLSGDGLKIMDNCGGIPVDDLKSMVMRFGKSSVHEMGIGAFGVGLNRALFKLGRVSHLKTDTGKQRAELVLNTKEYIESTDWLLPAEEFTSSGNVGTEIEIRQPAEEICRQFADAEWKQNLRHQLGQRYARFVAKGLILKMGGVLVENEEVPLRDGGLYQGQYKFYKTENGVAIHIVHGEHKDHRFTKEPDYDAKRNAELTDQYGWTILCNDRAIVICDRTDKTGWDSFHTEFYGFVGSVNFVCAEPGKLPWHTTKTDVDLNNHAYRAALADMRRFTQSWRTFAEARKKNVPLKPIPPKASSVSSPSQKAKPTTSAKPARPVIKPIKKVDHIQSRMVLPNDVDERHCNDKHLRLVHEGKRLDLAEFTYSGLALIRMLFESSVVTYMERHNQYDELKKFAIQHRNANREKPLSAASEKALVPTLDEMVAFLENNPEIWGAAKQNHLKHSLREFAKHKPMINGAIHNPWQQVPAPTAFEIRDQVLPMLRHIIEK